MYKINIINAIKIIETKNLKVTIHLKILLNFYIISLFCFKQLLYIKYQIFKIMITLEYFKKKLLQKFKIRILLIFQLVQSKNNIFKRKE